MSKLIDRPLTEDEYEELAWAYYQTLPLEHFMEATPQATQRKIFLESLDLVQARRPDIHAYSELLVQYRIEGDVRRVVPDNMVCVNDRHVTRKASYNVELQPVGPLWVLEWVSSSSEGKDYGEAFHKYERELKVPYCLQFHPDEQDFRIYRHDGHAYRPIVANAHGRFAVPELEIEAGLVDGWVRFWFRGELLPLPADMQREIEDLRRQTEELRRQTEDLRQQTEELRQRSDQETARRLAAEEELARLKALLGQSPTSPNGQSPSK